MFLIGSGCSFKGLNNNDAVTCFLDIQLYKDVRLQVIISRRFLSGYKPVGIALERFLLEIHSECSKVQLSVLHFLEIPLQNKSHNMIYFKGKTFQGKCYF